MILAIAFLIHQPAGRRAHVYLDPRVQRSLKGQRPWSVEALDAVAGAGKGPALALSGVLRRLAPATRSPPVAGLVLALIALAAIFAPRSWRPTIPISPTSPGSMQPPSAEHWFGTDNTGRDILGRVLYGTRNTLMLGLIGVIIGGLLGGHPGHPAAFHPRADGWIMRLVDVMLAFPAILIGLAGGGGRRRRPRRRRHRPGRRHRARRRAVARGAAVGVMGQEFMEAGRAVGVSDRTLIWRYLTLNCISTIFVFLTLRFGQIILIGSALGFLGMGAQPPTAELGMMAARAATSCSWRRTSPRSRAARSSSSCWPPTCWATRCATFLDPGCRR